MSVPRPTTVLAALVLAWAAAPCSYAALQEPEATPEVVAAAGPVLMVEAPSTWLPGQPCPVTVRVTAPADGLELPLWLFGAGALTVDGVPLGERVEGSVPLAPGQTVESRMDVADALAGREPGAGGQLELLLELAGARASAQVRLFAPAPEGLDFMTLPVDQLGDWEVLMFTTQGTLWFELYPDSAPNHVRNFLDLSYTGFYDGSGFHRVIPGFMAQGGRAKAGETAPRTLRAEFSTRRHTPGTLSAARLPNSIDSATSEFFVMHVNYPSLNGKYSVFGQLVEGIDVVDRLVQTGDHRYDKNSPKGYTPITPQLIERALVVRARKQPAETGDAPK